MLNKWVRYFIAVFAAMMFSTAQVNAATIVGEISISGGLVPIGGTGLADATGIDFLEWDGAAYVSGTSGGSFTVASVSGIFADYITPSPFVLGNINDFSFNDSFAAVTPLWEIGGFMFDLLSVSIVEQTSSTLILTGSGEMVGNGYGPMGGGWILTANSLGTTFSWSASTAVPEASSLALLALGLLGLGIYGRRKSR